MDPCSKFTPFTTQCCSPSTKVTIIIGKNVIECHKNYISCLPSKQMLQHSPGSLTELEQFSSGQMTFLH